MNSRIKIAGLVIAIFAACAAVQFMADSGKTRGLSPLPSKAEGSESVAETTSADPPQTVEDLFGNSNSSARPKDKKGPERTMLTTSRDILIYMALILALIGGCVFILKKAFPATKRMFKSDSVEVMGRTYISPKQFVCLVRVGGRVLVLGCTAERINVLSEIVDLDEVAALHETARKESADSMTSTFLNIFKKQNLGYAEKESEEGAAREPKRVAQHYDSRVASVHTELEKLKQVLSERRQDPA